MVGDAWLGDAWTSDVVLVAAAVGWAVLLALLVRRSDVRAPVAVLLLTSVVLTCLPFVLRGTGGILVRPLLLNGSRYAVPGIQLLLVALLLLLDRRRVGLAIVTAVLLVQSVAVWDLATTRTAGPRWTDSLVTARARCATPQREPEVVPRFGGRRGHVDVPPEVGPDDVVVPVSPVVPGEPLLFGVVVGCHRPR